MEEELFSAEGVDVKILGVKVDAKPEQLKLCVNGVDVTKHFVISSLKLVKVV